MSGLQFQPLLVHKIKSGAKTQTRRLVKGPLRCPGCGRETLHGVCTCHEPENRPIRTVPINVCRYKPGKSVAVQPGRGKAAMCRIRILEVEHQLAGDITLPDALAEGFRTTDEFKQYWIGLHEKPWLAAQTRAVEKAQADADPDDAVIDIDAFLGARSLDRFEDRHTEIPVWLILFELDHVETKRFLGAASPLTPGGKARLLSSRKVKPGPARKGRNAETLSADEQAGYVSNPSRSIDELEAVSAAEQATITERANMTTAQWMAHEAARRDLDRALLSREDQIVRLQRAARLRGVDVSREVWALQNSLKSANFETKAARAEAKVFRMAA